MSEATLFLPPYKLSERLVNIDYAIQALRNSISIIEAAEELFDKPVPYTQKKNHHAIRLLQYLRDDAYRLDTLEHNYGPDFMKMIAINASNKNKHNR